MHTIWRVRQKKKRLSAGNTNLILLSDSVRGKPSREHPSIHDAPCELRITLNECQQDFFLLILTSGSKGTSYMEFKYSPEFAKDQILCEFY